jgi:purine-nucleoside phosphorylase
VTGSIEAATGYGSWRLAVVLGSGLSALGGSLTGVRPIPYEDIEGMPTSGIAGHEGSLYAGKIAGVAALVFAGRAHLYEGHSTAVVTTPVRLAVEAGCEVIVLTNAAGGVNPALEVGAPCLISDHLNLTGQNPLTGPHDGRGPRFLDLTEVYDKGLRALARKVDPALQEGVYAGLSGPTYETPAEVRMLARMGADLVGMSTVHEAIVARYLGAAVLGVSVVTNPAAGISLEPLDHEEVAEAGRRVAARLEGLLKGVCAGLSSS